MEIIQFMFWNINSTSIKNSLSIVMHCPTKSEKLKAQNGTYTPTLMFWQHFDVVILLNLLNMKSMTKISGTVYAYITTSFNLRCEFMKYTLFKIEIACNRMQFSKMLHEVSETKVLHHWRHIEYRKLCSNTTTVHQFYIVCMHILWTDFKWSLNCMLRNSIYYTLTYVYTMHKVLPTYQSIYTTRWTYLSAF